MLEAPADDASAEALMNDVADHVASIREQGSAAAPARIGPLLSWFWWLQDSETWPMLWSSARTALTKIGFLSGTGSAWEQYAEYREHFRRFGPGAEVEYVLARAYEREAYGLDISTSDRLERVALAPHQGHESFDRNQASINLIRTMAKTFAGTMTDGPRRRFAKTSGSAGFPRPRIRPLR